jgi:threonyl-tRNA synthetase
VITIFHAQRIHEKLQAYGIRSEIDTSASTISYKIREAEIQKIPYMVICGEHEANLKKISIRKHGVGNLGLLTTKELTKNIKNECGW